MLHLSPFLFPWGMNNVRLSSPLYSQGNWGTEQPGAPHSAWAESSIPWGAKGCPECRGKITKSTFQTQTLSNPIRQTPQQGSTETWRARLNVSCIILLPVLLPCSLFHLFLQKKEVHLQGLFWSVVYGWMLPLIVNGAIRPLLYIVSIGVWQRIWRMLYLHSRNIYTKDRAFTAFSFTIISALIQEGQLCVVVCPSSCKGFSSVCVWLTQMHLGRGSAEWCRGHCSH